MTTQEFIASEHKRLVSFKHLIELSLNRNAEIDAPRRQEIMQVVIRAFEVEIEYMHEEPEHYRSLYHAAAG